MSIKKQSSDTVQELIDGIWDMDQTEFEQKYFSLSSDDMEVADKAIDQQRKDYLSDDFDPFNPPPISI